MRTKQAGLTLVELMVVVAVMAIIASIAYPLFTSQVQKSRRADAKVALEAVAMAQERYYTVAGEYANTLSTLQVSTAIQAGTSDQGYYDLAVSHPDGDNQKFLVTATAASGGKQASDADCNQFSLNQLGERTATDGGSTNCWGN